MALRARVVPPRRRLGGRVRGRRPSSGHVGSAVVSIRAAQPADYERLRELTFESKVHWGYDRDFVRRWADGLGFDGDEERWVAEVEGEIVAWAALVPVSDGVVVLDDLWVDPAAIGRGIGSRP